jgi:glycerol kinase
VYALGDTSLSRERWCNGCGTTLGVIKASPEIELLAATVKDNGEIYFVPEFSGLFTPDWKSNAQGACGDDPLR